MKGVLRCVAVFLAVLMIVSGVALVRGSLEVFPTEEQQEKVRLVYGMALALFAVLEMGTFRWLRRL
jgi:hypothetical protein